MKTITVTELEYQHLLVTLEGCRDELEELMREFDHYVTELPDRLQACLEIIEGAE